MARAFLDLARQTGTQQSARVFRRAPVKGYPFERVEPMGRLVTFVERGHAGARRRW